jgi:hypothetical protein
MAKAVANPIPLKAGRWSVHPRSKGNFVFSFDGNIPSHTSCPTNVCSSPVSWLWATMPIAGLDALLVHGVPITDNEDFIFGPEALLKEVQTLPGLKKIFFSMQPRWLKQIRAAKW